MNRMQITKTEATEIILNSRLRAIKKQAQKEAKTNWNVFTNVQKFAHLASVKIFYTQILEDIKILPIENVSHSFFDNTNKLEQKTRSIAISMIIKDLKEMGFDLKIAEQVELYAWDAREEEVIEFNDKRDSVEYRLERSFKNEYNESTSEVFLKTKDKRKAIHRYNMIEECDKTIL